jgi:tRNA pseudouridine-54 N-methylase
LRNFLLLARKADLSVHGGLLTRFVAGALLLSHGTRKDVWAAVLFDDEVLVSFEGWGMRNVRPDEQSLSGILRAGLRRGEEGGRTRILQGVIAKRARIEELAPRLQGKKYFFEGPGSTHGIGSEISVVFGCRGVEAEVADGLRRSGFEPLRLGVRKMTADQAAVIVNNVVDRSHP